MLSDWVAGLGKKDRYRTAWLSLDEGDNDLTRLLTHLVAAFDTTRPSLTSEPVLASLPGEASTALTAFGTLLAAVVEPRTQ